MEEKIAMKTLKLINPENVSEEEVEKYPVREAARAIVIDEEGKIVLLHVAKKNYYKLPGGGLDAGEEKISALRRECLEEIGCDVEVTGEVGIIIEYRKFCTLKQISYCYLAKLKGAKGSPKLEEGEIEDGFKEVWLSYEDALRAMAGSTTDFEGSSYIVERDRTFLEAAKEHLVNHAISKS